MSTVIINPAELLSKYSNNFYVLTDENGTNPGNRDVSYFTGKNFSYCNDKRSMIFYHESQITSCPQQSKFIRRVTFTAESGISVRNESFGANEFFLSEKEPFNFFEYVSNYLDEPENCVEAVKNSSRAFQYIKSSYKTYEICKLAVSKNGMNLKHVPSEHHSAELDFIAVKQNGMALQFVQNKSEEMYKFAVQNNCCALQYVEKQTPEIVKLAVMNNPDALEFVDREFQTQELYQMLIKKR